MFLFELSCACSKAPVTCLILRTFHGTYVRVVLCLCCVSRQAYGKFGQTLKERLSSDAMESLTEDPAAECSKEMWDAFFGGVQSKEFDSPVEFKKFVVDMLNAAGIKAEDVEALAQGAGRKPGQPMQRAMQGGGMPNHPALAGGGPPR